MRYISTRGQAPVLEFEDVLLAGLARDGGLYVPEDWPQLSADDLRGLSGAPYTEFAFRVMQPFVGGAIADDDLRRIIAESIPLDAAGLLSDAHHCRRGQLRYSIRGRPPPDPQQHELGPGQVRGLCARLHRYQRADLSPFLVVGRVIALR